MTYIINNSNFKPENISNDITLSYKSSKDYNVNFTLDQKKWLKISQNSSNFNNFEFNSNKFEIPEYKNFISNLIIRNNIFPPSFVDPDFNLYKDAQQKIENLKSSYDNLIIESEITSKKFLI